MNRPLVTVICLCYNQSAYLRAAIQSVLDQRYPNVELIVVDDASTDGSPELISQLIAAHPGIKFIPLTKNSGNCKAFNQGLKHAKGDFIIDLAADDILQVNRIEEGVKGFESRGPSYGVNYTNAEIIDEQGTFLEYFYKEKKGRKEPSIAEGWVFKDLLLRHFICPPTLMFRREVYDTLEGYDENLAYEDFDFLLRASKKFKFFYVDQPLVKRRIVEYSMSKMQYKKGSSQLYSTYDILVKAKKLTENKEERKAWRKRIKYEWRKSFQLMDMGVMAKYLKLYLQVKRK